MLLRGCPLLRASFFSLCVALSLVSCDDDTGDDARSYCCKVDELTLDTAQEKQWKQIGSDPTGLRLQVRFVKKAGPNGGFSVQDIRATVPDAPTLSLPAATAAKA